MRLSDIPANSLEASTLLIPLAESGDRRLLEKRLRDPEVMLTMDERAYLAARLSRHKQGRPRLSNAVKLWIATSVIRHQFVNGMGADDAAERVAQEEGCDKRTVQRRVRFAKDYEAGAWWGKACEQAQRCFGAGRADGIGTAIAVSASIAAGIGEASGIRKLRSDRRKTRSN